MHESSVTLAHKYVSSGKIQPFHHFRSLAGVSVILATFVHLDHINLVAYSSCANFRFFLILNNSGNVLCSFSFLQRSPIAAQRGLARYGRRRLGASTFAQHVSQHTDAGLHLRARRVHETVFGGGQRECRRVMHYSCVQLKKEKETAGRGANLSDLLLKTMISSLGHSSRQRTASGASGHVRVSSFGSSRDAEVNTAAH